MLFLSASVEMADSNGSFASSPDPVDDLAADVRVLRHKVCRQGNCLHQIDVLGGRRLEQLEEDIGRLRTEFQDAMRKLEAVVQQSLDQLDNRMQSLEQKWAKRKEFGNAGPIPTSGAEAIRR